MQQQQKIPTSTRLTHFTKGTILWRDMRLSAFKEKKTSIVKMYNYELKLHKFKKAQTLKSKKIRQNFTFIFFFFFS